MIFNFIFIGNVGFGLGKDVILLMVIKIIIMVMVVVMVMTKLMKIEMYGIDDWYCLIICDGESFNY